ncbi:hypothetical protein SEUCBS139899_008157 [Sporothrix eucalyptigena]
MVSMTMRAGLAALGSAFTIKLRGNIVNLALAEETTTNAMAAATAARAVAGTKRTEGPWWNRSSLEDNAEEAIRSAEAAYMAASAGRRTKSHLGRMFVWMLTSVMGIMVWPVVWFLYAAHPSPIALSSPRSSVYVVVNTVTEAALKLQPRR